MRFSMSTQVGLVEYEPSHDTERHRNGSLPPLQKAARMPDAAGYGFKWLLQLDGHSFSNRLQHLLLTNSAVLKQESEYIEYYYRALQVSSLSTALMAVGCRSPAIGRAARVCGAVPLAASRVPSDHRLRAARDPDAVCCSRGGTTSHST